MVNKEDVLKVGKTVYEQCADTLQGLYAEYSDENSNVAPAYICAEERFISGHDDTARFVEIIDTDGNIMRRWSFLSPMAVFHEPWLCADECLILYLMETFKIPLERGCGYRGHEVIKVEELF